MSHRSTAVEVAEPETARAVPAVRSRLKASFGAAVPIVTVFFWLCLLYGLEAWGNVAPWLNSDEYERSQLARAVAALDWHRHASAAARPEQEPRPPPVERDPPREGDRPCGVVRSARRHVLLVRTRDEHLAVLEWKAPPEPNDRQPETGAISVPSAGDVKA